MAHSCWACGRKQCSPYCKKARELSLCDGVSNRIRHIAKALEAAATSTEWADKLREQFEEERGKSMQRDCDTRVWHEARKTALYDYAKSVGVKL